MSALLAKRRIINLLLFIPNMLLLCARLLTDSRVPGTEKALLAGAIVYAIVPLDLIPDMIPFVGQIDDAYLIALTLLRLMERTDPRIVREHWSGGGDVVELVGAAAMLAAKFLPKPIRRVLTSRVEVAPEKGDRVGGIAKPLLVARPEGQEAEGSKQEAGGRWQKAEGRRQRL
ncbi:MAG: YkvA family protein [Pyrinomonadaceae bacterium]